MLGRALGIRRAQAASSAWLNGGVGAAPVRALSISACHLKRVAPLLFSPSRCHPRQPALCEAFFSIFHFPFSLLPHPALRPPASHSRNVVPRLPTLSLRHVVIPGIQLVTRLQSSCFLCTLFRPGLPQGWKTRSIALNKATQTLEHLFYRGTRHQILVCEAISVLDPDSVCCQGSLRFVLRGTNPV